MQTGALRRIEGDRVTRRALHQGRNESFVADAIRQLSFEIRGTMDASAKGPNGEQTATSIIATRGFAEWSADVGYRHQHGSLTQVFARAIHALMHKGGGYLHRIVSRPTADAIDDPHRNGLMLQAFSAMDIDRSQGSDGWQFNAEGRLVGIWFKGSSPDDHTIDWAPVLLPASDLHIMEIADDTSATRAISWGTAAMKPAAEVARADAARLGSEELRASLTGIALASDRHPALRGRHLDTGPSIEGGDGYDTRDLDQNTIMVARGIEKFVWSPTTSHTQTPASRIARVAAGLGMPVQSVTGDLSDTSFSAARLMSARERRTVEDIVERADVQGAKAKILMWFLQRELQLGNDWTALTWTWRARKPLEADQLKAAQADEINLRNGTVSRRQIIERDGRDYEVTNGQIQADNDGSEDIAA
jgi:hypothetical protein